MNINTQLQLLNQDGIHTTICSLKKNLEIMYRAYQLSPISETHDLKTRAAITDDYLILSKFISQDS